jgi:hypothetical protein
MRENDACQMWRSRPTTHQKTHFLHPSHLLYLYHHHHLLQTMTFFSFCKKVFFFFFLARYAGTFHPILATSKLLLV